MFQYFVTKHHPGKDPPYDKVFVIYDDNFEIEIPYFPVDESRASYEHTIPQDEQIEKLTEIIAHIYNNNVKELLRLRQMLVKDRYLGVKGFDDFILKAGLTEEIGKYMVLI